MAASVADDTDNFKAVFKKYKRRDQKLDLSGVIDIDQSNYCGLVACVEPAIPSLTPVYGIKPVKEWKVCHFHQHTGFYLIRNPFSPGFQRYWVSRCLEELPQPPNVTNLRVHPDVDPRTLWSDFVSRHQKGKKFDSTSPLRKLRWTTIGYHYNWDTKEYHEDDHTSFPEDIGLLSQYVAEALGFSNFQAEAGIINYYHMDSTLAGHTDHSELDHEAPLISISFGQDAIFLLGGLTKATEPTAILLQSGDICVMSGPSRLAYHAVPRILPPSGPVLPACFEPLSSEQNKTQTRDSSLVSDDNKRVLPSAESTCDSKEDRSYKVEQVSHCIQKADKASAEHLIQQQQSAPCCDSFQTNTTRVCSSNGFRDSGAKDRPSYNICDGTVQREKCREPSHILTPHTKLSTDGAASVESQTGNDNALVNKVNHRITKTLHTLDWEPFAAYLSSSRLNVNIRQVLKPGQTFQTHTPKEIEIVLIKQSRTENL